MTTIGKWYIAIYIGDDWDTIWKGKNYFTTIVNDAISFDTKQEAEGCLANMGGEPVMLRAYDGIWQQAQPNARVVIEQR